MNRNELLDLINQFKWNENDCPENNLADLLAMINYKNREWDSIEFDYTWRVIYLQTQFGDCGDSCEFGFDSISYKDLLSKIKFDTIVDMDFIEDCNKDLLDLSLDDIEPSLLVSNSILKESVRYMIEKMVTSFMDKWSLFNRFMTKDEAIEEFKILNNRFDFIDTISHRSNPLNKLIFSSTKCKDINISYNTNVCDEDFSVTLEK